MDGYGAAGIVLLILVVIFYFLPSVIAGTRNANHQGAIFFINLLFGWTILGWIAALIWAIVEAPEVVANPWSAAPAPVSEYKPMYPDRSDGVQLQDKPWAEPLHRK